MGDETPWGSYKKDPLPKGLTYRLRPRVIAEVLRAEDLRVDSLSLVRSAHLVQHGEVYTLPRQGLFALSGSIVGDTLPYKGVGGINGAYSTHLNVSALPSTLQIDEEKLFDELGFIVKWMKQGLTRGNGWLASGQSAHSILTANGFERRAS